MIVQVGRRISHNNILLGSCARHSKQEEANISLRWGEKSRLMASPSIWSPIEGIRLTGRMLISWIGRIIGIPENWKNPYILMQWIQEKRLMRSWIWTRERSQSLLEWIPVRCQKGYEKLKKVLHVFFFSHLSFISSFDKLEKVFFRFMISCNIAWVLFWWKCLVPLLMAVEWGCSLFDENQVELRQPDYFLKKTWLMSKRWRSYLLEYY